RGLVMDSNYDNSNFSAFIINNNYPQAFGTGPQSFLLRLFSEPTLLIQFTGDLSSSRTKADAIATQFSQGLGAPFTFALALPLGLMTILIYSPTPALSNSDALRKVLAALPSTSLSNLVNPANVENQRYFAMLGLLPSLPSLPFLNMTVVGGFSFLLDVQFPRMFYREGPHQLSFKTLLGFQGNIAADPAANVSAVTLAFQPGTVLYSPLGIPPCYPNPCYYNSTSTYYLNSTAGPTADLYANFTYPFAPNVVLQKTVSPVADSVGSAHTVTLTVQNLDIVSVENLTVTDPETSSSYQSTLQLMPGGTQTVREPTFAANASRTLTYTATPASSGTYVLSPATAEFLWLMPNGTRIRYTVSTDEIVFTSNSGPMTQFGNTMNDLWPYSTLLLLSLVSAPLVEVARRVGRKRRPRYRMPREHGGPPPVAISGRTEPSNSQ
ncbi:MAG TPA: hypothetical protein VIH83_06455, partial [Candidatus Bathyarchaeia archaeon]